MKRRINKDEKLLLELRRALTAGIKAMRERDRLAYQLAVTKQNLKAERNQTGWDVQAGEKPAKSTQG